MLIIHIGSPKTGTTAIQGMLKVNRNALAERGLSYVQAGRTNIAHNSMVKPLLKGRAEEIFAGIRAEIEAAPDHTHVLSSEVFFQPAVATALAKGLSGLPSDIRVVGYVRRPDLYVEAMYKQKVKNGRIAPDPDAFLEGWMPHLAYAPVLTAYRNAFGSDAMRVRPFERRHFPDGDVINDFLGAAGLQGHVELSRPETPSNKTLSRAVSEHLGRVNRHTRFNTRVMIREIAAAGAPDTIRSGDVYDKPARLRIIEATKADQAEVAAAYFPNLDPSFDTSDLADGAPDPYPSPQEAVRLEQAAAEAVMAAVGRQAAAQTPAG